MTGYILASGPVLRVYMTGQGRRYLPVDELLSMQSDANYTWLLLKSGERILIPRTLKYLEACLPAGRFLRLRRQLSVNVDQIAQIVMTRYNRMTVLLHTGEQVVVARRRIVDLREQLPADLIRRRQRVESTMAYGSVLSMPSTSLVEAVNRDLTLTGEAGTSYAATG